MPHNISTCFPAVAEPLYGEEAYSEWLDTSIQVRPLKLYCYESIELHQLRFDEHSPTLPAWPTLVIWALKPERSWNSHSTWRYTTQSYRSCSSNLRKEQIFFMLEKFLRCTSIPAAPTTCPCTSSAPTTSLQKFFFDAPPPPGSK